MSDTLARYESALQSIAANSCCAGCREAALVARKALGRYDIDTDRTIFPPSTEAPPLSSVPSAPDVARGTRCIDSSPQEPENVGAASVTADSLSSITIEMDRKE